MNVKSIHPNTLFDQIIPARPMQIAAREYAAGTLQLAAPLQPNSNDKGTGFAGSISSLLVLTGWGLVTLEMAQREISADVVVSESNISYLRPVRADMQTTARIAPEEVDRLLQSIQENGKGSIKITVQLFATDTLCAEMTGRYVALKKA